MRTYVQKPERHWLVDRLADSIRWIYQRVDCAVSRCVRVLAEELENERKYSNSLETRIEVLEAQLKQVMGLRRWQDFPKVDEE